MLEKIREALQVLRRETLLISLFFALFIGAISDVVTTQVALNLGGLEINQIVLGLLNTYGFLSFLLCKVVATLIEEALLFRVYLLFFHHDKCHLKHARKAIVITLSFLNILTWFTVGNNISVIQVLSGR